VRRAGEVTIRRSRSEDAAFIRSLSAEVFSEYTPRAAERALPMMRGRGSITLVAECREQRAGFVVLVLDGYRARIDAIAVSDTERGRGVGRRLLAAAERVAREHGAGAVELVTADANLAALDLFLRAGFDRKRRLPRHYPRGQDAHLLRKRLAGK